MIVECEVADVVTQSGFILDTPVALPSPSPRIETSKREYCERRFDGDRDGW